MKYDAQYSLHLSFCDEDVLRTRCRAELIEFVAVTSVNLLAGICSLYHYFVSPSSLVLILTFLLDMGGLNLEQQMDAIHNTLTDLPERLTPTEKLGLQCIELQGKKRVREEEKER